MPVHGYDGSEFLTPFDTMRSLELKIPPLLLCLVFAGLIAALAHLLPQANLPFTGNGTLALIALAGGLAVMFGGAIAFRRRQSRSGTVRRIGTTVSASPMYRRTSTATRPRH